MVFVNKKTRDNPYIIVVQCEDQTAEKEVLGFLQGEVSKCVVKSKTVAKGSVEMNYEVRLKADDTSFINRISDMKGVSSAVLVSYNGDYMG